MLRFVAVSAAVALVNNGTGQDLSDNGNGCYTFGYSREACIAHKDGRASSNPLSWLNRRGITGSPCQWCCGESCKAGGGRCEPKAFLEIPWINANYIGRSENGLGAAVDAAWNNCPAPSTTTTTTTTTPPPTTHNLTLEPGIGCFAFGEESACLAHADGRTSNESTNWVNRLGITGSPCQWCCGEACVAGGIAKCEPKAFLDVQSSYMGQSRNGLGEDTCPTPAPPVQRDPSTVKVLAHYMIWFGNNPGHDHWTGGDDFDARSMLNFDRFTEGCNNTQQVNSWFPPEKGKFYSTNATAVAEDMQEMVAAGVYGIIIDHQLPDPTTVDGQTLRAALPIAIAAAERAGLKWAIMYDGSNSRQRSFRFNDAIVNQEWADIIALADNSTAYLKDSSQNRMFFAFGETPFPNRTEVSCASCVFYSHGGTKRTGVTHAPGAMGAFAWFDTLRRHNNFYGDFGGNNKYPNTTVPVVGLAYAGFEPTYRFRNATGGHFERRMNRSEATLLASLQLCAQYSEFCQLASWNDFNEGTHIQPSHWCSNVRVPRDGTSGAPLAPNAYVEVVRSFTGGRRRLDTDFPLTPERKPHPTSAGQKKGFWEAAIAKGWEEADVVFV